MPRHNGKRHRPKGTNNAEKAAKKAASDDAVARGEPNPTPVGRPPTQEADPEVLSPTETFKGLSGAKFEGL